MSSFEILCTTMHQTDFSKIEEMNIRSNVVFANQCDRTAYEEMVFDGHTAKMISTTTRGVGKNRNLALMYATADICLFADDDLTYADEIEQKVVSEFLAHPDADIVIFNIQSDDPDRKPTIYPRTKKWTKWWSAPWGGARIAFRLNSIKKANMWFTTLFGGGCTFPSGEDSIWLKSAQKAGLRFYVSREIIGKVSYEESTWFTGYNEKYYYGVGACYAAINPYFAWLKFLYTLYRNRHKKELRCAEKLKWMKNGRKGYQEMLSYDEFVKSRQ